MERSELIANLDRIASEIEATNPVISLAIDIVSDQLEHREAGLMTFVRKLFPKLPTKEEALKTLKGLDKGKLSDLIKDVSGIMQGAPKGVASVDFGSIVKNLKGLGDPKVILAIIALMGSFNTTDAGIFSRLLGKETQEQQERSPKQILRGKIMSEFKKAPTANRGYANIVLDGQNYSVGKGESSDMELALSKSGMNASEAVARMGQEEGDIINKKIGPTKILDEFQIETKTGYIAYTVLILR